MKPLHLFTLLFLFSSSLVFAQDANEQDQQSEDTEEAALAKATQNPLAAMYSLPFQNNTTFGVGEFDRTQNLGITLLI